MATNVNQVLNNNGGHASDAEPHRPNPKTERTNKPKPGNKSQEQDRFFIEAASDRRGAQLADAIQAASYRKAMAYLNQGYSGEMTQAAMQALADDWNSQDFLDIAAGETIKQNLLPTKPNKNYFALPSAD
ncbi:hypothetical protein PMG71_05780 [Roseofilum sp. BLCC_M154]|uniref:Uncharacterized protein n=1 Tax=Roseofilum acuticapitatum BLCC-M154 TaxID=3022444 RepID=A0ABT7APU8_9CYAN|nr:hypothetical protein [Roseofilum acuticapitatum]MDJ1168930.1 hypothetical protein [Roseofilum acuticapitatum BLCC-M154]